MDATDHLVWAQLRQRSGPSDCCAIVDHDAFSTATGLSHVELEASLAHLEREGAIVAPSAQELERVSKKRRLGGDYVMLSRAEDRCDLLRVIAPSELHRAMAVTRQLIDRRFAALQSEYPAAQVEVEALRRVSDRFTWKPKIGTLFDPDYSDSSRVAWAAAVCEADRNLDNEVQAELSDMEDRLTTREVKGT